MVSSSQVAAQECCEPVHQSLCNVLLTVAPLLETSSVVCHRLPNIVPLPEDLFPHPAPLLSSPHAPTFLTRPPRSILSAASRFQSVLSQLSLGAVATLFLVAWQVSFPPVLSVSVTRSSCSYLESACIGQARKSL